MQQLNNEHTNVIKNSRKANKHSEIAICVIIPDLILISKVCNQYFNSMVIYFI